MIQTEGASIRSRMGTLHLIYGEAFRLHSHQLLAWAYADVRYRLKPNMEEPEITGILAEGVKARLSFHPDTPDEYLHYWCGDQEPVKPRRAYLGVLL